MTYAMDAKVFKGEVGTLAAGNAVVVDARGMAILVVITGTGATASVSRVDAINASAHTTGTENAEASQGQNLRSEISVDWPFYRISVAGGALRYALV